MDSTESGGDNVPKSRPVTRPKPTFAKPPPTPKKPPNLGVPDFTEWSEFIGEVVLRWVARAFVAVALRGIDRDLLTKEDEEDLELDDEQLNAIAKPFAGVATRSKFLAKHGRQILDSRDAIEAAVIFFMWTSRVRRIGHKYRPKHERPVRSELNGHVRSGNSVPEEPQESQSPIYRPAVGAGFN